MASEILDRLLADIKTAMKARDSERLETLRFLHSEIKNFEVNERKEPTDDDVAAIVGKAIKSRQDAIEQFKAGGRDDLADREQAQIEICKAYQPEQLGEAEIEALVDEVIQQTGAESKRDTGKVMKELMPRVKGKADGKLVSAIVGRKLADVDAPFHALRLRKEPGRLFYLFRAVTMLRSAVVGV